MFMGSKRNTDIIDIACFSLALKVHRKSMVFS